MKTIFRIIIILLAACVVAGGIFVALSGSSAISEEGGERPAMTTADGATMQPMERPEGGEHEASFTQGLFGLFATALKLAGIALFVLLLEKGFGLLSNRTLKLAHRQEG